MELEEKEIGPYGGVRAGGGDCGATEITIVKSRPWAVVMCTRGGRRVEAPR